MKTKTSLIKSAGIISLMTLLSKFLGFLREIMIAGRFGSGIETDTYAIAMTGTVIIMGTLGGALNTTLVPIFLEIEEKYGKKAKLYYLNNVINLVLRLGIILIIIGFVASPLVIKIIGKGFEGEQFNLAVKLNRIGLPIIGLLGITYVLTGFLNSSQIFGPPAISGIPYNLVFIIFLGLFGRFASIERLMLVTVVASLFQTLIMLPALKHMGYKFKNSLDLKDPFLRRAFILIMPVLLGSAVQQINTIVDKTLASELVDGSISALNFASRINDMVVTVFIMAITTVIFPMISKSFMEDDYKKVRDITGQGINIILIITIPATMGILLLGKPIVYLFFQRGAFNDRATEMTSMALKAYSIGLVGQSVRLLLNRVYYSLQDTYTPMINGMISVGINLVLNLILVRKFGHTGLALATSLSAIASCLLLFRGLNKRLGRLDYLNYLKIFIKSLIGSIIMAIPVYLVFFKLGANALSKGSQLIYLIVSVVLAIIVYFISCLLLRLDELTSLIKHIKR